MKLILEGWRKFISEATQDEADMINDAMDVPISEYPFGDIFGDSYRKIMEYRSIDPNTPFGNSVDILKLFGWTIETTKENVEKNKRIKRKTGKKIKVGNEEFDETEVVTVMGPDGKPERVTEEITRFIVVKPITKTSTYMKNGEQITRTSKKVLRLKPLKVLNEMMEFVNGLDAYNAKREVIIQKSRDVRSILANIDNPFEEKPSQEKIKKVEKEFAGLEKQISKLDSNLIVKANKLFIGGIYADNWTKFYAKFIKRDQKVFLLPRIERAQEYLNDGTKVADLSENYEDYLHTQYFIFSRHPMDVFRMSDHPEIRSCHDLPSIKGNQSFDQYNICALSEAYAGGMIVYAVSAEEFVAAGIPPTQETMDKMADEELFIDTERGVGGLNPSSRIRVKNVAFIDPETDEATEIASPQGKIYGKQTPDFDTFIYKELATLQKDKIEQILAKSPDGKVNLSNFTRYGGSYQDPEYHVSDVLPLLFDEISPALDFEGEVLYDPEAENTILATRGVSPIRAMRLEIESLVEDLDNSRQEKFKFEIRAEVDDNNHLRISEFWMRCKFAIYGKKRFEVDVHTLRREILNSVDEMAERGDFSIDHDSIDGGFTTVYNVEDLGDGTYTGIIHFDKDACLLIFGPDIESIDISEIRSTIEERLDNGFTDLFDRYADDGVVRYLTDSLEKKGLFTSELFALTVLYDEYDLEDLWWDEKSKTEGEDSGSTYISSAVYTCDLDFHVNHIVEDEVGFNPNNHSSGMAETPKGKAAIAAVAKVLVLVFDAYFLKEDYTKDFIKRLSEGKQLSPIKFSYEPIGVEEMIQKIITDSGIEVTATMTLEHDQDTLEASAIYMDGNGAEQMEQVFESQIINRWIETYRKNGELSERVTKKRMKVKILRG